jgi:hypothetical protein
MDHAMIAKSTQSITLTVEGKSPGASALRGISLWDRPRVGGGDPVEVDEGLVGKTAPTLSPG